MKAVLFDLDQTLLDRDQSLQNFLTWQCEGMLRPYLSDPAGFIRRFIELDANGSVWKDKVYSNLISEFELEEWWSTAELLSVYELCFCAFSAPKVGAIEAVTELSPRYKLGLISNGMTPFQERNFRGLGISSLFESVIVSSAVNLRKPDRAIFDLACAELNVVPGDACYVGDNPVADMEGANAAGLRSVFIPSFFHTACEVADVTCSDLRDLPRIVDGWGNP